MDVFVRLPYDIQEKVVKLLRGQIAQEYPDFRPSDLWRLHHYKSVALLLALWKP